MTDENKFWLVYGVAVGLCLAAIALLILGDMEPDQPQTYYFIHDINKLKADV